MNARDRGSHCLPTARLQGQVHSAFCCKDAKRERHGGGQAVKCKAISLSRPVVCSSTNKLLFRSGHNRGTEKVMLILHGCCPCRSRPGPSFTPRLLHAACPTCRPSTPAPPAGPTDAVRWVCLAGPGSCTGQLSPPLPAETVGRKHWTTRTTTSCSKAGTEAH